MRWKGRKQSQNIKDLRGTKTRSRGGFGGRGMGLGRRGGNGRMRLPGGLGGGIGRGRGGMNLTTLIIIGVVLYFLGINPLTFLMGGGLEPMGNGSQLGQQETAEQEAGAGLDDEAKEFVGVVLKETENVWNGIFASEGQQYKEPTLVLFSRQVRSACGFASSATGPFYCPADSRIYLDTNFFNELAKKFDASGDFAQAYVIAHEVGHHIQNLTGVLPEFNRKRRSMSKTEENAYSVRVELQADCYAGVWGHYTEQKGLLEKGDLQEALNAATQIGDDTLQRKSRGYVVPESFNHGTSEQRRRWFDKGFKAGRVEVCDTFNVSVL